MAFWRMQLHPDDSDNAMMYTIQSIAAGFIGLDFLADPGDLRVASYESLPPTQKDYWNFAHKMAPDDMVLIVAHHFPFALVTVSGEYNYIRTPDPKIGVWFRHFRRIREPRFYADRVKNAHDWENLVMTDTISILNDQDSKSYKLIQNW